MTVEIVKIGLTTLSLRFTTMFRMRRFENLRVFCFPSFARTTELGWKTNRKVLKRSGSSARNKPGAIFHLNHDHKTHRSPLLGGCTKRSTEPFRSCHWGQIFTFDIVGGLLIGLSILDNLYVRSARGMREQFRDSIRQLTSSMRQRQTLAFLSLDLHKKWVVPTVPSLRQFKVQRFNVQ